METVTITHTVPKDFATGAMKFVEIMQKLAPELKDGADYGDLPEVIECAPDIWEMVNCFIKSVDDLKADPMGCAVVLASMIDNSADAIKKAMS